MSNCQQGCSTLCKDWDHEPATLLDSNMFKYKESGIPIQIRYEPFPIQKKIMSTMIQGFDRCHDVVVTTNKENEMYLAVLVASLAWRRYKFDNINTKDDGSIPEFNGDDLSWMGSDKDTFKALVAEGTFEKAFALYNTKKSAYIETKKSAKRDTWQPADADSVPKIFISCPTYDRIAQLIRELNENTVYRPTISVLGGQKQTCINNEFNHTTTDEACSSQIGRETYGNKDVSPGSEHEICSCFYSKAPFQKAEIIFLPYKYLVDTVTRNFININLEDAIVIIDDAEAVIPVAKEAFSLEVTDLEIGKIQAEFGLAIRKKRLVNTNTVLLTFLGIVRTWMKNLESQSKGTGSNMTVQRFSGENMIDKFFDMKITPYTWDNIYKPAFEEVLDFFEFDPFADDSAANKRPNIVTHKSMRTLQTMLIAFNHIFDDDERYTTCFTLALIKRKSAPAKEDMDLTFCLWCTDANFILTEIAKLAHSVVKMKIDNHEEHIHAFPNNDKIDSEVSQSISAISITDNDTPGSCSILASSSVPKLSSIHSSSSVPESASIPDTFSMTDSSSVHEYHNISEPSSTPKNKAQSISDDTANDDDKKETTKVGSNFEKLDQIDIPANHSKPSQPLATIPNEQTVTEMHISESLPASNEQSDKPENKSNATSSELAQKKTSELYDLIDLPDPPPQNDAPMMSTSHGQQFIGQLNGVLYPVTLGYNEQPMPQQYMPLPPGNYNEQFSSPQQPYQNAPPSYINRGPAPNNSNIAHTQYAEIVHRPDNLHFQISTPNNFNEIAEMSLAQATVPSTSNILHANNVLPSAHASSASLSVSKKTSKVVNTAHLPSRTNQTAVASRSSIFLPVSKEADISHVPVQKQPNNTVAFSSTIPEPKPQVLPVNHVSDSTVIQKQIPETKRTALEADSLELEADLPRLIKVEPGIENYRLANSPCDKPSKASFVVYHIPRKHLDFDANGVPHLKKYTRKFTPKQPFNPYKSSILPIPLRTQEQAISSIAAQREYFRNQTEQSYETQRIGKVNKLIELRKMSERENERILVAQSQNQAALRATQVVQLKQTIKLITAAKRVADERVEQEAARRAVESMRARQEALRQLVEANIAAESKLAADAIRTAEIKRVAEKIQYAKLEQMLEILQKENYDTSVTAERMLKESDPNSKIEEAMFLLESGSTPATPPINSRPTATSIHGVNTNPPNFYPKIAKPTKSKGKAPATRTFHVPDMASPSRPIRRPHNVSSPSLAPTPLPVVTPRYKSELSIAGQNLSFFSGVKEEASTSTSPGTPKREYDNNVVEFVETASGLVLPKRRKK